MGNWDWDERYSASDRIWSGQPNTTLVAETTEIAPGRALDVGCGEGADAVWLARRGWHVTAVDVSEVALSRASQVAEDAGVEIEWVHSGLVDADLPAGVFDLVTVHYPALLKTSGQNTERVL
ncbi:MAG TPA: class I SAM-dependent methyltransferase, partial [Acidimicrobiales bacterium]|nr:class I SAM-dependent methyltransferase [Acidimicrobiales bacterium]